MKTKKLNDLEMIADPPDLALLEVEVVRAEARLMEARCAVLRERRRLLQAQGMSPTQVTIRLVAQQFAPPTR